MNKLFIIGIGIAVAISLTISIVGLVGVNQLSQLIQNTLGAIGTRFPHGLAVGEGATVATDGGLYANKLSVLSGTTTLSQSPDGFIVWGSFTMTATGSAKSSWTNTYSDMLCDSDSAFIRVTTTGFSPSLIYSLSASSTASTIGGITLVASTTVGTTTSAITNRKILAPADTGVYYLPHNYAIVGSFFDITNTEASSTHFGNNVVDWSIHCWLAGQ